MKLRYLEEKIIFGICLFAATVTAFLLVFIIGKIAIEGLPAINPYFLLTPESDTEGLGRGILNAVIGTILISFFSTIIATPLAIGTAIYLQKYSREGRVTRSIRFFIEVLSGTPSIVLGIFGLFLLVYYMRIFTGGFSLLAGSIALAILILPVIERATETAISALPPGLEEGSYALGATKWQNIRQIVIPSSISGIITGVILGFGRAAEESAVVVLTAGYTQFIPEFGLRADERILFGTRLLPIQDLVGTLPLFVYYGYQNSAMIPIANTFAAAFILIIIVLLINLSAKTIFWYFTRTTKSRSPHLISLTRSIFSGNGRFSRTKPLPVAACAAAEIAEAERESTISVQASAHHKAQITPSPISTPAGINWKETRSSNPPAAPQGSPSAMVGIPSPPTPSDWTLALTMPIPVASSHPSKKSIATPHPASTQANPSGPLPVDGLLAVNPAAAGHSLPPAAHDGGDAGYHDLLEDDPDGPAEPDPGSTRRTRHPAGAVLLEEPHIPLAETWRSMTKNQQENMHV